MIDVIQVQTLGSLCPDYQARLGVTSMDISSNEKQDWGSKLFLV